MDGLLVTLQMVFGAQSRQKKYYYTDKNSWLIDVICKVFQPIQIFKVYVAQFAVGKFKVNSTP